MAQPNSIDIRALKVNGMADELIDNLIEDKQSPSLKKGMFLRVEWEDIYHTDVPSEIFDSEEKIKEHITPMIVHTYGELLAMNDRRIVLAMEKGRENDDDDTHIAVIPIGTVRKVEILKAERVVEVVGL